MNIFKHQLNIQKPLSLLMLLLAVAVNSYGQEKADEAKAAIKVAARAGSNNILLRWAPNDPVAWQLLNKYGYKIDRVTLMRNGKALPTPELVNLYQGAIKPAPLASWEQLVDDDKYAAIAAQAIYGETFEMSEDYRQDIVQVINKSRELEQRFSFALFAADMSAATAKKSALSYTDEQVKAGERYLYRVYSPAPESLIKVDTGYYYIGLADYQELPAPVAPEAEFADLSVMLKWNRMHHADTYTAYEVERSEDGKNYKPISDLPLINSEPPSGLPPEYMFVIDSLSSNNQEYFYRIRGLTPFGEKGPYSEAVSGIARDELEANPAIAEHKVIKNQTVELKWFFDDRFNYQLESFTLSRAAKDRGPYEVIAQNIPPDSRMVTDKNPKTTNYYRITAKGKYGQESASMPYLVQLVDSIPPAIPTGITGTIDTTGLVTLHWKGNKEEDLRGYRIFRSNYLEDEFTQITVDPVADTIYYDTIPAKAITEKVFYTVAAVDMHYNPSDFSQPLELVRPDLKPPVSPVFTKINAKNGGIELAWVPSSSTDVKDHLLYRKADTDKGWALIRVFNATDTTWTDPNVTPDKHYQYTLIAVDHSKLESAPAQPLGASPLKQTVRQGIGKLYHTLDEENKQVTLAWEYEIKGVENYVIFRAENDNPITPLQSVAGTEQKFTDERTKAGNSYRYQVMAQFADGAQSALSEVVTVKIK